jgi:hypothetical protein
VRAVLAAQGAPAVLEGLQANAALARPPAFRVSNDPGAATLASSSAGKGGGGPTFARAALCLQEGEAPVDGLLVDYPPSCWDYVRVALWPPRYFSELLPKKSCAWSADGACSGGAWRPNVSLTPPHLHPLHPLPPPPPPPPRPRRHPPDRPRPRLRHHPPLRAPHGRAHQLLPRHPAHSPLH